MPVLPPTAAPPYDVVSYVLHNATVRMNGKLATSQATSGKLLENSNAFTQQIANAAWRKTQEILAEKGYSTLNTEVIIFGFPIVASLDPAAICWLDWTGCFDGQNFYTAPALPSDFTHPLKMSERWSNQNAIFPHRPNMEKMLDGIPMNQKCSINRVWEWRQDRIWIPGSQVLEDFRIRYIKYLPDFQDIGTVQWFQQPVPIMRSADAISCFMCAELAGARGDEGLKALFVTDGVDACNRVFANDVRADQRVNVRRQARTGRQGRSNYGYGWY